MTLYDGFKSPTGIRMQGDYGFVEYGNDRGALVMFFDHQVVNQQKSREAGTPIYDSKVFISVTHPAEGHLQEVKREMREEDKYRWPQQYRAYMEGREHIPDGTPIHFLFPDHPNIAANLKALGIHTIEQCSKLSATAMDRIGMGAQDYVNAANAYLDVSREGLTYHKMQTELKDRDAKIATLERQLGEMSTQMTALMQQMEGPGEYVSMPRRMASAMGVSIAAPRAEPKDHLALPSSLKKPGRKPKAAEADASAA